MAFVAAYQPIWRIGAAMWPAILVLCCTERAGATCGEHVRIAGADELPAPVHDRPCRGPNCTGGPLAPIPDAPAPHVVPTDVKGLVSTEIAPDSLGSRWLRITRLGGSPVRHSQTIFQPPRLP